MDGECLEVCPMKNSPRRPGNWTPWKRRSFWKTSFFSKPPFLDTFFFCFIQKSGRNDVGTINGRITWDVTSKNPGPQCGEHTVDGSEIRFRKPPGRYITYITL